MPVGHRKTPAGYGTHFKPGISASPGINSILFSSLRRARNACKPLFRVTVPGCVRFSAFCLLFLARAQLVIAHYRPIGCDTKTSPSPLNRSGERLHRGDIGSQCTATSEGHHWGLESEKNNCHYPCQEKLYRHEGINLGYSGQ